MARILIVDDDPALAQEIAQHLSKADHTCLVEHSGERAIEAVRPEPVDLLVLDIMLPGISGYEVCRRIHADTELYAMPILFLSAMGAEEEVIHGLDQGADDYLAKPFRLETLAGRIENLLAESTQSRMIDDLTSLHGPKYVKLEVQKAINLKRPFAITYIELLHLGEFGRKAGTRLRAKAVRHLARALHLCGKELDKVIFKLGHMGGGHFVCIVSPEAIEPFCERTYKVWQEHLERFYIDIGMEAAYKAASAKPKKAGAAPLLDVLFCVTTRDQTRTLSYRETFEVLTHLHQKALTAGTSGIVIDRRA